MSLKGCRKDGRSPENPLGVQHEERRQECGRNSMGHPNRTAANPRTDHRSDHPQSMAHWLSHSPSKKICAMEPHLKKEELNFMGQTKMKTGLSGTLIRSGSARKIILFGSSFLVAVGAWFCCSLIQAPQASAARFTNQFLEFELPPGWQCALEGAEWVCQNTNPQKKKDAIIVLAGKLRGDQDTLESYLTYLKSAKTWTSVQGKPMKSEMKFAELKDYSQQAWVDSLHLESEIPGYFTRYFGSVKLDIAVLVTFSVMKDKYQEYLPFIENMISTLRVFRNPGSLTSNQPKQNLPVPQVLSQSPVFPNFAAEGQKPEVAKKKKDDFMFILLVVVGVVAFIIWRKRRGG